MIVIHYTAMRGGAGPAIKHLCDPVTEVSCHYVIDEDGTATQLVDDVQRAWHAGAGRWGAHDDVNSRSLGIELSNDGFSPFPAPQVNRLERLLSDLMARHSILPHMIIGHSDCAPGRKIDPGPRFDWRRLARQGLSIWPAHSAVPVDEVRFLENARTAGWTNETDTDTLLSAIRLRFRPWATGPLDDWDCGILEDIARRFPVDQDAATA
ncbi:MAG: N-acetylmuramoyl-L-alanine amidase [Jannaschia sp.]